MTLFNDIPITFAVSLDNHATGTVTFDTPPFQYTGGASKNFTGHVQDTAISIASVMVLRNCEAGGDTEQTNR
jgi:hypothetical protein